MNIASLYDSLASLPLFRGISGKELAHIADKMHLRWLTMGPDQPLIKAGEPCQHVVILTEGELIRTTSYDGTTYIVTDSVRATTIIEPEQLYGLTCTYRSDYRTHSVCKLLLVPKEDVREALLGIPVFRINLLNLLASKCTRAQQACDLKPYDIRRTILQLGSDRPLSVRIRMIDLARYLGTSRTTISHKLHELEEEGRVKLHPNLIEYIY